MVAALWTLLLYKQTQISLLDETCGSVNPVSPSELWDILVCVRPFKTSQLELTHQLSTDPDESRSATPGPDPKNHPAYSSPNCQTTKSWIQYVIVFLRICHICLFIHYLMWILVSTFWQFWKVLLWTFAYKYFFCFLFFVF